MFSKRERKNEPKFLANFWLKRIGFCEQSLGLMSMTSVTRLGDFEKVLGNKISSKKVQIIGNFLGYFEKPHSCVKTASQ